MESIGRDDWKRGHEGRKGVNCGIGWGCVEAYKEEIGGLAEWKVQTQSL